MQEWITTCGELAGAALITAGVWDISHPLGLITAGLFTIGISFLGSQ